MWACSGTTSYWKGPWAVSNWKCPPFFGLRAEIFLGDQFYCWLYIIPNLKPEYGDVCRGSEKKVRKSASSTRLNGLFLDLPHDHRFGTRWPIPIKSIAAHEFGWLFHMHRTWFSNGHLPWKGVQILCIIDPNTGQYSNVQCTSIKTQLGSQLSLLLTRKAPSKVEHILFISISHLLYVNL